MRIKKLGNKIYIFTKKSIHVIHVYKLKISS
jgi:hypothetical protein